jgi:subtilisin family serine protease
MRYNFVETMNRYLLIIISLLLGVNPVFSQQNGKSILLNEFIKQQKENDTFIHIALVGNPRELSKSVISSGGNVTLAKGDIVSARIPVRAIESVLQNPFLRYYDFDNYEGQALSTDPMLPNNNVTPVHIGTAPINFPIEGEDVIAGIIDSGIDITHPDFLNEDGSSRILYLWDHVFSDDPDRIPQPYGYGKEWTNEEINQGLSTHIDQPQHWGHGSMVGSIFFGNGEAVNDFKGVAPKSDIIVVSSNLSASGWLMTIADAVDYIFNRADEIGKPVVINASLGSYLGSHDGLDPAALLINGLVNEQAGRSFVCAVGNSGHHKYHLGLDITPDTSFTWLKTRNNMATGFSGIFLESWADVGDIEDAHFAWSAIPRVGQKIERGITNYYQINDFLNEILFDSIVNINGEKLADVQFWAQQQDSRYRIQMAMISPDSTNYYYSLKAYGEGRLDAWSGTWLNLNEIVALDEVPEDFPNRENYFEPDTEMTTVSSFACSPEVITVGNLINRNSYIDFNGIQQNADAPAGSLAFSSSHGPTRDGRLKPELTATGNYNFGAAPQSIIQQLASSQIAPGGFHQLAGGSSAAAPVVAGVVALYLQLCPSADIESIRDALFESATGNSFSGILPNMSWGYGRVNGFGALLNAAFEVEVSMEENAPNCGEMSVKLIAPIGFDEYLWSNGATESEICVSEAGNYSVMVKNEDGCFGFSNPILVEPLSVTELNELSFNLFPNPVNNRLNLNLSQPINQSLSIEILDLSGRVIFAKDEAIKPGEVNYLHNTAQLSEGIYFIRLFNQNEQTTLKFAKVN